MNNTDIQRMLNMIVRKCGDQCDSYNAPEYRVAMYNLGQKVKFCQKLKSLNWYQLAEDFREISKTIHQEIPHGSFIYEKCVDAAVLAEFVGFYYKTRK